MVMNDERNTIRLTNEEMKIITETADAICDLLDNMTAHVFVKTLEGVFYTMTEELSDNVVLMVLEDIKRNVMEIRSVNKVGTEH
jgi:hypothetical protein